MEIANALLGAYLDSLTVRLQTGELGEVTDLDLNSENEEVFEITTENGSFWVNKNGVPCDYERHDNPSNVVEILEE
ncbi:hypothetical protein ACFGWK_10520 [Pasteurella multocida]|uniref:hypothetical protein n=1 Tax=Pasteurella multocida TaxID=747 RepID=UPI002D0D862E|nr:hypothetical protein [Pasteurella multocida]MEB3492854.1 hypothetical protein [Pasteurella multocida]HDR1050761.1 hypothetical protein [Pasteurella multocida]